MRQLYWLIFGLVLLSQCTTTVAAARSRGIREGKACRPARAGEVLSAKKQCRKNLFCNGNTRRCARLGSLGAPCKTVSTDCALVSDAVCYRQQCYGNTARPKLSPCSVDAHCATGYCGVAGRCALQHLEGSYCRRPQQCISGACDDVASKCVVSQAVSATATSMSTTKASTTTSSMSSSTTLSSSASSSTTSSSTTSSTSTSSTPSTTSTPTSVAAKSAYASATPVSDSQAYSSSSSPSSANRRMLAQRSGQVSKTGDVSIVNPDTANAAIRLLADSATPAALKQDLDTPLTGTPVTLRFHYVVDALQQANGQCGVVAFVNGEQLTPSLPISADAQTGTAAFPYSNTAPVTSYAVTVVCDGTSAGATLEVDTLTMSVDPPTCDASTTDCGFEASGSSDWTGVASGQSSGAVTSSVDDVHTGLGAYQCVVAVQGDRCGLKRSLAASSLTPGTTYTLTFWSKSTPAQNGVLPTVRIGKSSSTYFNGASSIVPTSVAADNNGFQQYTATFTLPTDADQSDVKVQVSTTDVGTYDYDDFSLTAQASAGLDNGGLPTGQCSGLTNCGFEGTGGLMVVDANGNTDSRAMCTVTTQDALVRSGQQAQVCTVANKQSFVYLQGGGDHTYAAGSSYVWTFWVQLSGGATASSSTCIVWANDGDGTLAYKGACPFTTATPVNGFRQVAIGFTAPSAQMSVMISMGDVGKYSFDDVSMLDGAISTITYDSASPASATGSADTAFAQTCVGGLTNCDLETGYLNGYALHFGPSSSCAVTTDPLKVHAGTHALQCDTTLDAAVALQIAPKALAAGIVKGEQYTLSVWAKNAAATSGIDGGGGNAMYAVVDNVALTTPMAAKASTDANGFVKYAATFTASANTDQPSIAIKLTTPGIYYLDTFALVHGVPLPSDGDCTGMPNCGFEEKYSSSVKGQTTSLVIPHFVSSGVAPFQPTTDAQLVRSGLGAMTGTTIKQGDWGYLESNTSVDGTTFIVGAAYVWTFWAKVSGAHLNCVVWAKAGTGAVAYNGACPMTTAAPVNGFRQFAIPFTASDAQMDVLLKYTGDWSTSVSVSVDDFSILAGQYAIDYDLAAGSPALTVGSASTAVPYTSSCSGFDNCGFETGLENGLTWHIYGVRGRYQYPCVATFDPAYVYEGTWALQCKGGGDLVLEADFYPQTTPGTVWKPYVTYMFSVWIKVTYGYFFAGIQGVRVSDQSVYTIRDGAYADAMPTVTSASAATNGFAKFGVTFTVTEDTMPQSLHIFTGDQIARSPMSLDNFDLSISLPPYPEQWAGCNLDNCGFENDDSRAHYSIAIVPSCSIVADDTQSLPGDANGGHHAAQCIVPSNSNNAANVYLQRYSDDRTYTIGQPVIFSFWVRIGSASTVVAEALTCIVWSANGGGAVSYKGTCPVTAATPVNGFVQVAVQFAAMTTDLGFMIVFNDADTYLIDGVQLVADIYYDIAYNTAANNGIAASDDSAYAFTQPCPGGMLNCGFETGYVNGFSLQMGQSSSCAAVHDGAASVYDGKYALRCDSSADTNGDVLQITPTFLTANMQANTQYVFTFWLKSGDASSAGGILVSFDGNDAVSVQSVATANGFTQYSAPYTAYGDGYQPSVTVTLSTPDVYYIDSFDLAPPPPPPPLPQQWNGCSLDNCGFENAVSLQHYELGAGNDFGHSSCSVVSDAGQSLPNDANNGNHAAKCTLSADANAFAFVQRDYDGSSFVVGQPYVLSFWVRTGSASTVVVDALTCIVWSDRQGDSSDVSYKGTCPVTTAAPANGFVQVAVPFTASTGDLGIFITINAGNPDTYLFDGIDIIPGAYQITYDSTANHGVTASDSSGYNFQDGCFANFNNCKFETGFSNDWQLLQTSYAACGVFARTAGSAGSGNYALQCTLNPDGNGNTVFDNVVQHTLPLLGGGAASGLSYLLNVYLATTNRNALFDCRLTTDVRSYDGGTKTWTQMYAQYHNDALFSGDNTQVGYQVRFDIGSDDPGNNAVLSCSATGAGTYKFDDFSLE